MQYCKFTRDIAQNFDNGKFTLDVFIDLSKAFDTVDHQILLKKLKHYGVNEKTLTWLRSYLFQRKQYIENSNDIKHLVNSNVNVIKEGHAFSSSSKWRNFHLNK